ncbi:MAG TPA: LamG-like jellyroll fold domain-containing protein, partial [Chthoniobacterales bacterium]
MILAGLPRHVACLLFCSVIAMRVVAGTVPAGTISDVAVDVGNSTIAKLSAADGTVLWSAAATNDGAIAVDQSDLGVYTGYGGHSFGGSGTVYKYSASGTLAWTNSISRSGTCNFYYVNNVAVDATSSSPGVVWTEGGCFGGIAKSDRSTGSQQWSVFTNDIGRASIDPANGQIYAITNNHYSTIYGATAGGGLTSASSCEGYTDLNPADGMLYRGGNGCGTTLSQMNKSSLGATNWSMDLSSYIASFDALGVQPWNGGYIYVASVSSSKIVVVNPASQTVVRTFTTAISPNNIAVNPFGGNLYITDNASHFVYAYSPTGSLVWTSPDLGGAAGSIAAPRDIVGAPSIAPLPLVITAGSAALRAGDGFTLGTRFTVGSQNETVSAVGAWDGPNSGGSIGDGLQASKPVAIWDSSGNVVASATVPAGTGGLLVGQFRYVAISPVTLLANQQYILGAYYSSGDPDQLRDQAGGPTMSADFNSYVAAFTGSNTVGSISEPNGFAGGTAYVGPSFLYGGSCDRPPSNMVGWWPGDGNTKDIQGGHNGLLMNGATFGTGEVEQAFSFDGVDDQVVVANDPAFQFTPATPFSLDTWVFLTNNINSGDGAELITKWGTQNGQFGYALTIEPATSTFSFTLGDYGVGRDYANGTTVPVANTWYHVAATYDGTTMQLYVNGNLEATKTRLIGGNASSTPLEIGSSTILGDGDGTGALPRRLDEVEVFNRALSADEIQSVYYAGSLGKCKPTCLTPPSGLTHWWPGDNTATDIQGGSNGTLKNGATFANGKVDRAFSFNASQNQYVLAEQGAIVGSAANFTIDAWVKWDGGGSDGQQEIYCEGSFNDIINLMLVKNGNVAYPAFQTLSDQWRSVTAATPVNPNEWHHLVAVLQQGVGGTLYIDGQSAGTNADMGPGSQFAGETDIGRFAGGGGSRYLSGVADEVEVFGRALTAQEVADIYNAGTAGKCKTVR